MMLIFAKAAYDAGRYFGFTYDEIIAYGAVGFLFFDKSIAIPTGW